MAAALGAGLLALPVSALAADRLTGDLKGSDGAAHGTVEVIDAPKGVILRITATGLAPGWHGVHFHEKGSCTPPTFKSAGGHVHAHDVAKPVHGLLNANADDAGDLPNIHVDPDGTATVELYSTLVSFKGEGGRPALIDQDGSSLVIHAKPDDYQTQPIGGSGDRVACAVLTP
ncbi:Cu/Zn superoxide dismutase [Gluconacetobacter sacchari DSM 12717]|uniref:Cu/Zn superoxide dismutase n=1 Tax=Gluconacetobacter sacchari DSM 12717 TaxID=1307940 RepID=A0ABQ0PC36_9PROT|nr:Cu/Zn superoxide dismutase [Gluconacetobacter sacchari DSM 12717]